MKSIYLKYLLFIGMSINFLNAKKIGLLTVATGKYIDFVLPLINSAKKFFCTKHEVCFFVFTDQKSLSIKGVSFLPHIRLGWPYDTMMRVGAYNKHKKSYKDCDYLFACDADMLFVDFVGDEILNKRVGTRHPGFMHKNGSYEIRKESIAFVSPNEGKYYFAGGFYGGDRSSFCKINSSILEMIEHDKKKNIVAVWHDESYLNRYFINNPPTKILTPDYCFPDKKELAKKWRIDNFKGKLLALTKNHAKYRE